MIILVMTVQDVDRDYAHVDLSSFDALTVTTWAEYFLKDYAKWPASQVKPSQLRCAFYVDSHPYTVTARFHSPETFAAFLLPS